MLLGGCFVLALIFSAFECSRNDPVTTGELYQYGRLSIAHKCKSMYSYAFPQTCLGFRSHPPCDSNVSTLSSRAIYLSDMASSSNW
ncbi:hypothetical protein EV363DRAFT_1171091 [Boletus edulis]|nr:hypothetical protein EV363DRAFT_1171091 [Boletus edulis]